MKAQVLHQPGEPDQFVYQDWPLPEPAPGQVLVRIHATSVNPADYKMRRNGSALAPELPAVIGADVAGVIVAKAKDVSGFVIGDAVYGCVGGVRGMGGAYAEYIATDASLLALKPQNVSMREAAALPLVGITAYEGLVDRARLQKGQQVLIYGATGGVGHIAVQIAKARGAIVTAAVSSKAKADIARNLGADHLFFYRDESLEQLNARLTDGLGFDVVFDTVGGDNFLAGIRAARPQGQVITVVARQSYDLSEAFIKGLSLHMVFMLIPMLHSIERARHGQILRELAKLSEVNQLKPLLDTPYFSLPQLADAHRRAESGEAIGKVVVSVLDDEWA